MQKVIDFLEQKVEWIVIGLGFVFMLFMVWSYVLQPAAVVDVGGEKLTPGEVDPYTLDHAGKQLEQAIAEGGKIDVQVPTYVQAFKDKMSFATSSPVQLAGTWTKSETADITLPAAPGTAPGTTPPGNTAVAGGTNPGTAPPGGVVADPGKVTQLPVPPAPVWDSYKFGRSLVVPPPPPGQPMPQIVPGQDVPGAIDKDWITQLFKINMGGIDQAFKQAKIPVGDPQASFYRTVFLQVEMQRVEVDADGKEIGQPVTLPPIAAWRQNLPPPPLPAEVPPNADAAAVQAQRQAAGAYLQWAAANTPDILEPLYYPITKGDQWTKPGQQAMAGQLFEPTTYTGPLETLTPEQKAAVLKARQDAYKLKEEQKKANRPAPTPRTPSGPRGGPGNEGGAAFAPNPNYIPPSHAPAPVARPAGVAAPRPGPPPGIYRGAPPGMEGMDGENAGFGGGAAFGGPMPQNLPQPGTDYPNGEFDPSQWIGKTVEAWAHDDTATAGKTYKYRMRYKIKSPIFGAGNVANPDSLADVFAVASVWSEWSTAITIPPMTNFFVESSKSPGSDAVHFAVFKWEKGQQHKESFTVRPGDQIGTTKGDVDYSTPWTVVDFRQDDRANETQIILVNNDGKLMTRSYKADSQDPLFKALNETVTQQKAAAAVAAGTAVPGAPAGVGAPGGGPIGAR